MNPMHPFGPGVSLLDEQQQKRILVLRGYAKGTRTGAPVWVGVIAGGISSMLGSGLTTVYIGCFCLAYSWVRSRWARRALKHLTAMPARTR